MTATASRRARRQASPAMWSATVAIVLTILAPSAAFPQADPGAPPTLTCEAAGYDVILHNRGSGPIAAGTLVDWSVRFARRQGQYKLASPLEPGKPVFLSGALGSSFLGAGKPCVARIGS